MATRRRMWVPKAEGPNLRYETDTIPDDVDGAYDAEHLEVASDPSVQGWVDTITEGTISVPHSESQMISDAVAEQHEINREIERVQRQVIPSPIDTLWARRMRVHRFHVQPVQSQRLLQDNHFRRYFMLMVDLQDSGAAAATIALSDQPINAVGFTVPDNCFPVVGFTGQVLQYGPFFHQGELWGMCTSNATPGLSVIEYFGQ